MSKRGLSLDRHAQIGPELQAMATRLEALALELEELYGQGSRPQHAATKTLEALDALRARLSAYAPDPEVYFRDPVAQQHQVAELTAQLRQALAAGDEAGAKAALAGLAQIVGWEETYRIGEGIERPPQPGYRSA